jgi:glycosyltransferase involved in cell wall biosynthesis
LPNDSLGGAEQILKMIAHYYSDAWVEVRFLKQKTSIYWEKENTILKLSTSNNKDILAPYFNKKQIVSTKEKKGIHLKYQKTKSEYWGAFTLGWKLLVSPKKKYDIIFTSHVFITGMIGIYIRLGLLKKVHFIGRESTLIFKRFNGFKLFLYKKMYQFGYPSLDLLICQTPEMKQDLMTNLPKMNNQVTIKVIENPINIIAINSNEELNIEYPFIVCAGRLIPEKGFDILINAFHLITKIHPTLHLLILGEGIERKNLENQIKQLNLESKIVLKGHVQNVYPYFKEAKVCIISSRIEGFPNVLLQMMSQNKHVVATKCNDEIEQIPGIIVAEKENSINLSQAIIDSLNENRTKNGILFKSYLEERSIEKFICSIEQELIK